MPVAAEITRAETSERARLLRVRSYDIALDLTRGEEIFGSVSVIRFDAAVPGAASHADLVARTVHEITLNGEPLDPAVVYADSRITLPDLAAPNELRVVADCAYTGSGTGLHRSVDSADGGVYVYAKLAQAYARTAYACFDQPDLKAEFTFHVTAPAHWTVLSNAPATERATEVPERAGSAPDRATWHFAPTQRLPTFTMTVVAGDYHLVTASYTTPGGQPIPLELACPASLAAHLDPDAVFEVTRHGLDFYTGLLGRYPYAKYGQVFVPELSCLASEDAGCVLVSEQLLFRSRVIAAMDGLRSDVLLHEMAHMWFGDLVTEQWWDDLWLSESFADFCGHYALTRLSRFADAWSVFSIRQKARGFAQDQLPTTHPVATDAASVSAAIANFDQISYAKGAAVLRQLAAYVGEHDFFAGLRAYLAEHAYANTRLADLIGAVAASSGRPLAAWSKAWLETAGPNTLRAQFQTDADGAFTRFAVRQDAPETHPTLRPHHLTIGLYQRSGGRLALVHRTAADIAGARTEVPELTGMTQPDLILLNDDDTGYVLVRLDSRSLHTVTQSVSELADAPARAVGWNTVIDMVQQAELPVPAFVAMLARALPHEPSIAMLQALLAHAEQILTQLADSGGAAQGKTRLADAAENLLHSARPGRDHQLAGLQLLGWTATSAHQLDLITGLLDGRTNLPGLTVDTELARDRTDAGRRHAAACRAAIPDARHKEAAWQLLAGDRLGAESRASVASGFRLPEHAALLASYAGRYLTELEHIWATRTGHLRVQLGELLFPYPVASPDLLAQLDEFRTRPHDPGLTRILAERRDIVHRALRSRALSR